MAASFFRNPSSNSEQQRVNQEIKQATESLSKLLSHAQQPHQKDKALTQSLLQNAIEDLKKLRDRLEAHSQLLALIDVFEDEIDRKERQAKQTESELEQQIIAANIQRVTLLSQRDELANQLASLKRQLRVRT